MSGKPQLTKDEIIEKRRLLLTERIKLHQQIQDNPELIPIVKELCKRDIFYYFKYFAMTYDPRPDKSGRPIGAIPFDLFPFQYGLVSQIQESINTGHDLLVEKCRDMGVSWIFLTVYFHYWLFVKDSSFRIGSRNINEVDKIGEMGTLFEKIRFMIRETPSFLMPQDFNPRFHSAFTRVVNPENGASFVGETANPSFGRGGRNTASLMDEHAFWEAGTAAWESVGQTTQARHSVSTPNGEFNHFAKMANGETDDKPKKITLHWYLNPLHDEAWMERQKRRYSKSGLAREVLISYARSVEGAVFDMFNPKYHCVYINTHPTPDNPENLYVPNPNLPITVSFDFGRTAAALFGQIDSWYRIKVFHEILLQDNNVTTDDLGAATTQLIQKYNNLNPTQAQYALQYTGDPAGNTNPWQTREAFSDIQILEDKHNLRPIQVDRVIKARNRKYSGITLLQTLLNSRHQGEERFQIVNPDKCPILIKALNGGYRYKTDNNGDVTETIHEVHPVEDVIDVLKYMALQFAYVLPESLDEHNAISVVESGYVFPI